MRPASVDAHLVWLQQERGLDELQARFPDEWTDLRARLLTASSEGRAGVQRLLNEVTPRVRSGPQDRARARRDELRVLVQGRMLQHTLQSWNDRRESKVEDGAIRFRRFDGLLLQRTLFRQGLVRKPVRMLPFRLAWRLAAQRDRLMPLVRPQGIYCFYSLPFLTQLRTIAAGRPLLEIGAGDGTLTRLLRDAGTDAHASDDHSWAKYIDYPSWVEQAGARTALERHRPSVVVCSWPPPANTFERHVFSTASVQTYIAILSSDPRDAGDLAAYENQTGFSITRDPALDRLVLPTGHNRVLIFERTS